MVADLVFTKQLEEKDKRKGTMGKRDSWLAKDPSTALEDGDIAMAAETSG